MTRLTTYRFFPALGRILPCLLAALAGVLCDGIAQPSPAGVPLRLEWGRSGTNLVVGGISQTGALFLQMAGDLQSLAANPTQMLQVATPLTNGLSLPLAPAGPSTKGFFSAWFYPGQSAANLVFVPAGSFVMGSPASEAERNADETQHTVTLTRGFCISKYLVTQADYLAVVGSNPSHFVATNGWDTDLTRPVEQVSWDDATNYCAQLTAQEQAAGRLPAGWAYRLPTESEWEYACRAGTATAFCYGSALRSGMANFCGLEEYDAAVGNIWNPNGLYLASTTAVGSYQPNAWGLYDMHGNVWEWCRDLYGSYPAGSVTDPQGSGTTSYRVFRGGAWLLYGVGCRSACRGYVAPSYRYYGFGFRVVLAPGQP